MRLVLLGATLLCGCNRYVLFARYDVRASGSDQADVLFVIDNSDSMADEAVALAESFSRFISTLASRQDAYGEQGLPDAVSAYTDYVQDPAAFVDFQLAITTIDASTTGGALLGDPPVLSDDDPDLEAHFLHTLLCDAACFPERATLPSDPSYACEDGFTGAVSQEFLDCTCGTDAWIGHCGTGREEGLETVYDALCRAVPDAPEGCFDDGLPAVSDAGSSAALLRPESVFVPVIVTDEGDASHRMLNVDVLPGIYVERLGELPIKDVWAVIGPGLDEDQVLACPGLATSWGTLRYEYLVQKTGGIFLSVQGPDCGPADWDRALTDLGALVSGGLRAFELPEPAVSSSISVLLGEEEIVRAWPTGKDIFGEVAWSDGFSYDEALQTVYLHGTAVPELAADVVIWYQPARLDTPSK